MPLSEYEQRVLEQMERQLTSDDPKLANTFQGRSSSGVRRWLLAGAGALAGMAVLIAGTATSTPVVDVLGVVLMFGSVVLAFSPPRKRGPVGVVGANGGIRPSAATRPPTRPQRGFLARLEERWDRRREDRG